MSATNLEYTAVGGNRQSNAADWASDIFVFGAGRNVATWDPESHSHRGVASLLKGHTGSVNAIRIHDRPYGRCIISGSSDKTVRIWKKAPEGQVSFQETQCLQDHEGSINTIAVTSKSDTFVTGASDGKIKVWTFENDAAKLVQTISLKPRFIPITTALTILSTGELVLAVAGTTTSIQLFVRPADSSAFQLQATLTGHEGWIRSLDFTTETTSPDSDVLLASASQDKYIRLWRFRKATKAVENNASDSAYDSIKLSLSNKAHTVGSMGQQFAVTFEALLVGHEDWIYTARWAPRTDDKGTATLLSASADNSLSTWNVEEGSGLWVCQTRLGEISSQKGSTTATGSTGGFWIGLWSPDGRSVVSLGRTGSWRKWTYDSDSDSWLQQIGISGHTEEVQSLTWATDGSYLLSTGLDQTTRLIAAWEGATSHSWHEIARPQIHGYDLNCIAAVTQNQFVSGADEKLLRVFNKPKATDALLAKLSGIERSIDEALPDAANIPVLGLSNKAVTVGENGEVAVADGGEERGEVDPSGIIPKSALNIDQPPFEDHLARHTLWPEHEKLYGHGYEISAVAANKCGSLIATACKASSIDHAVIRLYETREWRAMKPPLSAHSLTVTSLAFSSDDRYLLSVGRDRQWALFERDAEDSTNFKVTLSNPKGHSRMILDCSWAPQSAGYVFATAGRDKSVKIWGLQDGKVEQLTTFSATAPVTAVAFAPIAVHCVYLAYGTEEGNLVIIKFEASRWSEAIVSEVDSSITPSGPITSLAWRPNTGEEKSTAGQLLAVASEDSAIRFMSLA